MLHNLPNFFYTNLCLLEELSLSYNMFNDLPLEFSNLNVLRSLNLSHNHFEFVPSSVLKLKTLKTLNMSYNSIESLPFFDLENLESLDLRENKILDLGGSLTKLKNLKYLQVDYEKLIASRADLVQKFGEKRVSAPESIELQNSSNSSEKRARAVMEILESEQKYQKYLKCLFADFYVPVSEGKMTEETSISKEELKTTLPSGFEPIMNLSEKLLKTLIEAIDIENNTTVNESRVGKIFINFAPFMKMYADYCAEYEKASVNVRMLLGSYPSFEDYLMEKSASESADGLSLASLLVMPIQRIMRYGMLLRNLIACTSLEHPDYSELLIAATKMEEIARLIDIKVDEYRISSKTAQLTTELSLTHNRARKYICEGNYTFGTDRYHIYLFNDMFVFCKIDLLGKIFGFSKKLMCPFANTVIENKSESCTVKTQNYEFIFVDPFWTTHIGNAVTYYMKNKNDF
jgi:hypothetical protein